MLLIAGYSPRWRETDPRPLEGYRAPTGRQRFDALAKKSRGSSVPTNADIPDLIGKTFGYLTVIEKFVSPVHAVRTLRGASWICRCKCGKIVKVANAMLTHPKRSVKSCGCLLREHWERRKLEKCTPERSPEPCCSANGASTGSAPSA